jgi:hypothetical protein
MVNYTQSIAEPFGWRFKIGLYHRMGNGYCFSSKHINNKDALAHFEKQIGPQRTKPRLIKWKPSRLEKFGSGNVAAVGLSCGFVEPLEANALYTIITSIRRLNNVLDQEELDWSVYNEKMSYTIDDIADFILVHYTLSPRQDTKFWTDMNTIGQKLNHKQLIWDKYNHPKNSMYGASIGYTMFPDYMWAQLGSTFGLKYDRNINPITKSLAYSYFKYSENKHNIISNEMTNSYLWLKENIFEGLTSKEWEEKCFIEEWIKRISTPLDKLDGFSVCPFAKNANYLIYNTDGKNISIPTSNFDLIVYILPTDYSENEVISIASECNKIYLEMVFLPDPKNKYTEINSVQTNNGKYNIILCQNRNKLDNARNKLKNTSYYSFWSEEYLKEILNT